MYKLEEHWSDFLDGDNSALGKLYAEVFEPLVFRAIYYTRDSEIARDIVSQLFEELISAPLEIRRQRWLKVRDINAFLVVIVRNKCLDHLKLNANRQRILIGISKEQELFSEESMEKELHVKLNQCIAQLSEVEQQLLEMHLNGYRNTAIAEELNLSEKTVRNKLSLTRKLIALKWHQLFILFGLLWR